MKLTERQNELLAILFAAGEPLEAGRIAEAMEITTAEAVDIAQIVADALDEQELPVEIRKLENSYQLCTRAQYAPVIRKALEIKRNIPLSAAAMETLAIIAYNQPVTRGFVEQVRGVDSSSVVISLVDKGLVEEAGRLDLPGKPLAYRTTANFLRCFSLTGLDKLPAVDEEQEETVLVEEPEEQISFAEIQQTEEQPQ